MVEKGKFVAIEYTGKFDDGEIFDSCTGGEPFEFQVGAGMVIRGLDEAVAGMNISEERDIVIAPENAYGEYEPEMVQAVPIEEIRAHFEPQVGMQIGVQTPDGMQIPAVITEIRETEVMIDMNHPLAGETLNFRVKVLEVNDEAKYAKNCSCCDSGCDSDDQGCSC